VGKVTGQQQTKGTVKNVTDVITVFVGQAAESSPPPSPTPSNTAGGG
jgi:hypothetical protein